MWGRFLRWYFRRVSYPWLVFQVLLSAFWIAVAVLWFKDRNDGLGWVYIAIAVYGLSNTVAAFAYRRRHPPPPKEPWLDRMFGG
jgi:hypothetical protein